MPQRGVFSFFEASWSIIRIYIFIYLYTPMLSFDQFTQLSYQEKKETLVGIFTQLDGQKVVSFEDVIFLLNASNAIKESTLDTVYRDLDTTLDKSKEMGHTQQELMKIKAMIMNDTSTAKEAAEAENLLDTI